jgi:hypothetical protein
MSEWQPIETAPKDAGSLVVWNGERYAVAEWTDYYGWWEKRKDPLGEPYGIRPQPTHWMPLPPPPSAPENTA